MKVGIHPEYYPEATVTCSCGNTWQTGSTMEAINTDLCNKCHPFYTGEQRIVDTEGQVERFYRKLEARQEYVEKVDDEGESEAPAELELSELGLPARALAALAEESIVSVGDVMERLENGGQSGLLAVSGFGRKSLIDLKKAMRARGHEFPGDVESP